ncbi:MAG: hypothetical protein IPN82_16890 [Chitinophagaceae bacterium]|nr:hypothetical protein [Chitinophagaceae bacterium]
MKKFTFKGIIAFFLLFAFSQNDSFSQTATITPANSYHSGRFFKTLQL